MEFYYNHTHNRCIITLVEGSVEMLTPQIDWPSVVDEQFVRACFTQGPKSESQLYDMNAYVTTLSGGEAQDLC